MLGRLGVTCIIEQHGKDLLLVAWTLKIQDLTTKLVTDAVAAVKGDQLCRCS